MATPITTTRTRGTGFNGSGRNGGQGDGGGGRGDARPSPLPLGMFFALSSIGMLFIAMTSAYVVRRGLGTNWTTIRMPAVLWLSTAALLASSLALELGRRGFALARAVGATLALGALFVAAQLAAWRALAAQGIFLSTNPHSAFFYLLTGMHGVHVLGGLAALGWLRLSLHRIPAPRLGPRLDATAMYWHFMFGLWLYLLVLLFGRI